MPQREIEIILARLLAEHLVTSIFIVDPSGNLIFYNEPAGAILGFRYDETGPMPASEWTTVFQPFDVDGQPLIPDDLPLVLAMTKQHAAHKSFWIKGLDGALRQIEVTAFPLMGNADRFIGAIAIFWEVPK
jgi:PAS domain-containing protein